MVWNCSWFILWMHHCFCIHPVFSMILDVWYHLAAFTCPADSTYNRCMSACPATCRNPNAPEACPRSCVEGCECNDGYVLNGVECVLASDCACSYNGVLYAVSSTMYSCTLIWQVSIGNEIIGISNQGNQLEDKNGGQILILICFTVTIISKGEEKVQHPEIKPGG